MIRKGELMNSKNINENLHTGHRERIKENFLKRGLSGFQHHEIIELLLFFGIPMKDTNEIAHQLINSYGSISAVFNAHYEDLIKIKGMTKNAAILLTMLPELFTVYVNDVKDFATLDNINSINDYFVSAFFGVKNEEIKICCLDNDMKIKYCTTVIEGGIEKAKVDMRKLVETVFRANATYVIVAHNHPNGSPVPSEEDIVVTRAIKNTFDMLNIVLLDHIVVGKNAAVSMKQLGYMDLL